MAVAVHPGGVVSDMSLSLPQEQHDGITDTAELVADSIVYMTRVPQPWLTGRYVSEQWDMSELEARQAEIVEKDLLKTSWYVKGDGVTSRNWCHTS